MEGSIDIQIRACLLGEPTVGKTCLLNRYHQGCFTPNTTKTIGFDFILKQIQVSESMSVRLQLWDSAGKEDFSFNKIALRKANTVIFVFDLTNYASFKGIENWVVCAHNNSSADDWFLVGTKVDLEKHRVVPQDVAITFAEDNYMKYLEVSAKEGTNVEELF